MDRPNNVLKLGVLVDDDTVTAWEKRKGGVPKTVTFVVHEASKIFKEQMNIEINVSKNDIYMSHPNASKPLAFLTNRKCIDGAELQNELSAWRRENPDFAAWVLFARKWCAHNRTRGLGSGITYRGNMGKPGESHVIIGTKESAPDPNVSQDELLIVTLAHELGHSLGAHHTFNDPKKTHSIHNMTKQCRNGIMDYDRFVREGNTRTIEGGIPGVLGAGGITQFHPIHQESMCEIINNLLDLSPANKYLPEEEIWGKTGSPRHVSLPRSSSSSRLAACTLLMMF